MKVIKIDKQQWAAGLQALEKRYRLFGPLPAEGGYHTFEALAGGQPPDFSAQNTRLSPKALLFPQSEALLEYSLDETREDHHRPHAVALDDTPRAVLGIRPCDAKAVELVKLNFDTPEYKEPYWLNAYAATTLVGLACDRPCSTCFCTSAGCGPYHREGLDVLLVDAADHYLAEALTAKGSALLEAAGWQTPADDAASIDARRTAAEARVTAKIATDNLGAQEALALHGAAFWEDVAFACINCGTCTYVCPTCWCFDLQDEVHGRQGKRLRNWDSCMFPLFTLHTTGHNPRGTKTQRVRQRFMHKLKYFPDKYGQGIMCVGCGRCVRQCPVNIDIRRVCDLMNAPGPTATCAAPGE